MNEILELLKYITNFGYEAYIVGGFIRDKLLNRDSFDVDICTNATKDELKIILPNLKSKDLFCSYMLLKNYNVEITTYRREYNYNGRRPLSVEYTDKLIDDLKRRDFTINTICMDKDSRVIDLLGGLTDLNNGVIRCVGSADKKLEEDTLRILRAIRFSSTLKFKIDDGLKVAIKKYKNNLSFLSSFRKRQELDKIVQANGLNILKEMSVEQELGISIPNKIIYTNDIIGTYAQCDIQLENFFNKEELKKYNLLKKYINKKLDKYDLFILGEDNIKILDEIQKDDLIIKYNNLKIHDERNLDINLNKLNSYNKEKVIRAILNGKLENNSFAIANFMANIL